MTFDLDLSKLTIAEAPRLKELQSYGRLLNAKDSLGWLMDNRGFIGWTYTVNLKLWSLLQPKQLIVDRCEKLYNSKIRVASCCHIKCYMSEYEMLIGSFNLTAPTIEDLCVFIQDKHEVSHMRKVFKQHWKALA